MNAKIFVPVIFILLAASCNNKGHQFDASGTFEVDEVVVSSEISGKILSLAIEEGDTVSKGKIIGVIDSENLSLQKEQVQASIEALGERTTEVSPQVQLLQNQLAVQQSQLGNLLHEKTRFENLLKEDAATGKQVDDINAQVEVATKQLLVTRQQISVLRSNTSAQNRGVLSERRPLQKRVAQFEEQLQKANIVNPLAGTVITRYAEAGELTSPGKALYKVADLSVMTLRGYITGAQLSQVKLHQQVKVLVDDGAERYKEMPGVITWISDKAEFTPKTIQTKDERANLVYAIKVRVKNDGYIKIGMYGEIVFDPSAKKK